MDELDLTQNNEHHANDDSTVPVPSTNHNNDIIINRFDVVLGRGKGNERHFGNQKFLRTLLSFMLSIYVRARCMFTHITLVVQPRQNITNRLLLFHSGLIFGGYI
jgi:hypothetical protein